MVSERSVVDISKWYWLRLRKHGKTQRVQTSITSDTKQECHVHMHHDVPRIAADGYSDFRREMKTFARVV